METEQMNPKNWDNEWFRVQCILLSLKLSALLVIIKYHDTSISTIFPICDMQNVMCTRAETNVEIDLEPLVTKV